MGGKNTQAGGRGKGWSSTELDAMLSVVEQLLPLGSNQWEAVQLAYGRRLPSTYTVRDAEAIKRKFYKLKNLPKPTGDPDCPEEVRRAKRAFRLIENRSGVQGFDDDDDADAADARAAGHATIDDVPAPAPLALPVPAPQEPVQDRLPAATSVAPTGPPNVSARSGLTPEELLALSSSLAASGSTAVSQSAQKRRRLDVMIDRLEAETASDIQPTNFMQLFLDMEERSRERELEYRREREERENRQRIEQQKREEREEKKDQLMMAILAKLTGANTT